MRTSRGSKPTCRRVRTSSVSTRMRSSAQWNRTRPTCACWSTISTSPRSRSSWIRHSRDDVRARLNGSGSLSSPADGEATTTIEEMALTWNGQPIATDGPATIRYANQQLAIDRFVVRAQDSTVAVKGTLPVDPRSGEGAIDLDAQVEPLDACVLRAGTVWRQGARSRVPHGHCPGFHARHRSRALSCRSTRDS